LARALGHHPVPGDRGPDVALNWMTDPYAAPPEDYNPVTPGAYSFTLFESVFFQVKSRYHRSTNAVQFTLTGGPIDEPVYFDGPVDGPAMPTPEPVTLVLLAASGIGALTVRRRRR